MTDATILFETERLIVRNWRAADLPAFYELTSAPELLTYIGPPKSRQEADAIFELVTREIAERGYGFAAVEPKAGGGCAGFVGIRDVAFEAPFTPAIEIGWRLVARHWGRGFAREAARGWLTEAFARFGLDEVVAFTVPANRRSQRVMRAIGMRRDPAGDFDHPALAVGHPLRRHILFRIKRGGWMAATYHGYEE